ncbi:DedA family protein [Pedobacter sp. SYP-B3415]|uniref:DedA family protein n=1 Tax=Pedobacter sp. SYP-B3415 TaxID=2496641 RepID=UPI00101CDE57|nr:DedA family protein [Pedobacter sp. SYP-B3415]
MDIFSQLFDFILHIDKHLVEIVNDYQTWTYLIMFLIIFAETGLVITPFLPGDSLLFAMGALMAKGGTGLDVYVMALLLCIAAITGNSLNYFLGTFFGVKVFKDTNRILKLEYYNKTHAFFEKHGGKAIVFSRYLPIFRTIAPFVAGVARMPFGRFTLFNVVGGISWIVAFLFAGFLFGNIPVIKENFTVVIATIGILTFLPAIIAAFRAKFSKKPVV